MKRTDAVQVIKKVTDYNKELGDHFAEFTWYFDNHKYERRSTFTMDDINKAEWRELLRVLYMLDVITKEENHEFLHMIYSNFEWDAEEDYRR